MRITNNMILNNTKTNINSNKVSVDKYNTQMTTQKKISKASEDPVIAIRALRFSTTMSHLDQYTDNNIPDAEAWLDVTYTALDNMKSLVTDIRTQCVNGSTDTLTADDRNTILKNLEALQDQIYAEGNSDYAGRTVFTGYRTNSNVTFDGTDNNVRYYITENFDASQLEQHRYYSGEAEVPTTLTLDPVTNRYNTFGGTDIGVSTNYRLRLAYAEIDEVTGDSITITDPVNGDQATAVNAYNSMDDWMASGDYPLVAGANTAVYIKETGELIFSDDLANSMMEGKASVSISYSKTGFEVGELKPEYYFDCTKYEMDENNTQMDGTREEYTLAAQDISYTIASNTSLTVNTQIRDVVNQDIRRDVQEMIDAVQYAIEAESKVTRIKEMMNSDQYSDEASQEALQTYMDVAQKEADYANDNLQKLYESYIGNFDSYLTKINVGITDVGSKQSRLSLTQNRVQNQKTTVEELQSSNEDRDISDIIIDYYAAYNAYTSSLTAASKVGDQTLLNYL